MSSAHRALLRHPDRHRAQGLVAVGWCHPGTVSTRFMESMRNLLIADAARPDPRVLVQGSGYISFQSGPQITAARTAIVENFLTNPLLSEAEWLWMVDADMVIPADTLYRLLDVAHPTERPIVGALCFGGGRSERVFPTIYKAVDHDGAAGVEPVMDYPRDALVKVAATGAACILIHRTVFLRMAQVFGVINGEPNPHPWFTEGVHHGVPFGEDIAFCQRARALDIPVHVDTRVKIGHVKSLVLDEAEFDRRQAMTTEELAEAVA